VLLVHREILAEVSNPDRIRFHFGAYGWCAVRLAESG
jgi:hypothetical protein